MAIAKIMTVSWERMKARLSSNYQIFECPGSPRKLFRRNSLAAIVNTVQILIPLISLIRMMEIDLRARKVWVTMVKKTRMMRTPKNLQANRSKAASISRSCSSKRKCLTMTYVAS